MQSRLLGWICFVVWAVWLFALHAWLGGSDGSRWMPDLGLVFVLVLMARSEARDLPWMAFLAALARSTFSPEPPLVLFTGFFGVLFALLLVRGAVELSRPTWRALTAFVAVLGFDLWLGLAHAARTSDVRALEALSAWPSAVLSALLALAFGPFLVHLPGLTPLRARRW
jgi:hypothetical protein